MSRELQIMPLQPFGLEIDLDLGSPLRDEVVEELKRLYDLHHLLVFRDQRLSHPQQIEFVSHFGPVLSQPDGVGYISNQPGRGGLGDVELAFHSDLAFNEKPFLGISLHAVDVENERSSTRFVDSCIGYRTLPQATKARLADLHALHVMPNAEGLAGHASESAPPETPRAVHPVVMTHPRTGEPILYINLNQTAQLVELERDEGAQLLQVLFNHLYRPEHIYEHRWRMGDLVLWDNLAAQHARGDVSEVGRRTLQRVVLAEKGFFEQNPQFTVGYLAS